jgi:hypothetical protein
LKFDRKITSTVVMVFAAGFSRHAIAAEPRVPDARAAAVVARMTLDEKIALIHGRFPLLMKGRPGERRQPRRRQRQPRPE